MLDAGRIWNTCSHNKSAEICVCVLQCHECIYLRALVCETAGMFQSPGSVTLHNHYNPTEKSALIKRGTPPWFWLTLTLSLSLSFRFWSFSLSSHSCLMLFFFSSLLHLSVLSSCVSFSVCLSLIFTLCRYMCVCGSLCWALSQGGGSSSWWGQSPEGLWVGKGRLWLCSHHRSVAFECVHSRVLK